MRRFVLAIMSAFMSALSFFSPYWQWLIWISFVPLIMLLDELHICLLSNSSRQATCNNISNILFLKQLRHSFIFSYLCGFIFFLLVLYWLNNVTVTGTLLLTGYLALYFGLFGVLTVCISNKNRVLKMFLIPCIWVGLEFIRAHLFTGFGWCSLGYSQYKNLSLIQIADITGVYGVSFLIVLVNVFFANVCEHFAYLYGFGVDRVGYRYKDSMMHIGGVKSLGKQFLVVIFIFVFVYGYGFFCLKQKDPGFPATISVAVIQADIPQQIKWNKSVWPVIMEEYKSLTLKAAAYHPQIIIWPETSLPGYLGKDNAFFDDLKRFVNNMGIPLLFGAVVLDNGRYYNSAIFLSAEGKEIGRYDKMHLVPFGEYIPLRGIFPFLEDIVPIGDFTAGREYKVFSFSMKRDGYHNPLRGFSVLICFEDTIPELSRSFVNRGAGFLVNITNDGWFKDTIAPYLHLQSSVFRTIENRRSLVRAANTGISCFIDDKGRIYDYVLGRDRKKTFVSGYAVGRLNFRKDKTFYTKFGDVFVLSCFLFLLIHCWYLF